MQELANISNRTNLLLKGGEWKQETTKGQKCKKQVKLLPEGNNQI